MINLKMKCNVVATFADGGAEVVMLWPHETVSPGAMKENGIAMGSLNLKMTAEAAAQYQAGKLYCVSMEEFLDEPDQAATH